MSQTPKLGATGRFPEGKLIPSDKGELRCAIGTRNGQVVMDFGEEPITWLSLPPKAARALAVVLLHKADAIDGGGLQ